jgi:cytochrome c oxidase assembly factor CtaG
VSPYRFTFEPLFLVLAAAAAFAYWRAARNDRPSGWRLASFAAGLFLVFAPLNSSLETLAAHYLLLMHLLQNALIADIAPLLVLLGLTPEMRESLNRRGARHLRARYALPFWLVVWYGTHAANFYEWALRSNWPLNIEHALLIVAGLVFWWPIVSGRLSSPAALAYLGIAFIVSSFLGLALIFSTRPLYAFYEHTPRLWGLSPARDQNLGGILMNAEQTLVFLLAIGYYVLQLLEEEDERGRVTESGPGEAVRVPRPQ